MNTRLYKTRFEIWDFDFSYSVILFDHNRGNVWEQIESLRLIIYKFVQLYLFRNSSMPRRWHFILSRWEIIAFLRQMLRKCVLKLFACYIALSVVSFYI